jgi:hypothetical protein
MFLFTIKNRRLGRESYHGKVWRENNFGQWFISVDGDPLGSSFGLCPHFSSNVEGSDWLWISC